MNIRIRRSAVGVVAVVSALSVAAPAHAAPGWRITATPDKNAGLRDVAVIGAKNAWAVGHQSVNGKNVSVVRRWNGKTWTRMSLPPAVKDVYLASVSASSGSNVWISGSDGRRKQYWMRWNGKAWTVVAVNVPRPNRPAAPTLLAVGARDVWSFARAGDGPFSPDIRHYNGRKWSKVTAPGFIDHASAVSGKEIWAAGWINGPVGPIPTVMRWNGKAWKKQSQPLGTRMGSSLGDILAFGGKNVWASGAGPAGRGLLLHWNGKTWSKKTAPVNGVLTDLVRDGNGGLWMRAGQRLLHYKSGKWKTVAVPGRDGLQSEIAALAHIPKTTSVWGVGALVDRNSVDKKSVVLKYGR